MSEIAFHFHEKAGRSQVDSSLASLNKVLFSRRVAAVAMLPSALSRSDSYSLGACWAFSFQPVLLSVWRPAILLLQSGTRARRLTQSPKLGFGLLSFSLPGTVFGLLWLSCFYAAAATVVRLLLCNGSYTNRSDEEPGHSWLAVSVDDDPARRHGSRSCSSVGQETKHLVIMSDDVGVWNVSAYHRA